MTTNVTVNTIDFAALVEFQDGSHLAVDAHSSRSFQLVDKGYCTITEVADLGPDEQPPYKPVATPYDDGA